MGPPVVSTCVCVLTHGFALPGPGHGKRPGEGLHGRVLRAPGPPHRPHELHQGARAQPPAAATPFWEDENAISTSNDMYEDTELVSELTY